MIVSLLHQGQNRGNCTSRVSGSTLVFVGFPHTGQQTNPLSLICTLFPPSYRWRNRQDSNPQETIADLYVGFLDRCATITPIFHFLLSIFTARIPGAVVPAHPPWPIGGDQPVKLSKPGRWHRRQDLNLRPAEWLVIIGNLRDRWGDPVTLTPAPLRFQAALHRHIHRINYFPFRVFEKTPTLFPAPRRIYPAIIAMPVKAVVIPDVSFRPS